MNLDSANNVHPLSSVKDTPSWRISLILFVLLLISVWAVLEGAYEMLPLIRPGADIVSNAKFDTIAKQPMFSPDIRNRVLIFGDSRVMAGFVPAAFDKAFGPDTRSYNMAIPGESRFLPILEACLASGNIPNYVLLTLPWDNVTKPPSLLSRLSDDSGIADAIFPFRFLPRDMVLFAFNSRMHLLQEYQTAAIEREKAIDDRGWYFIKSQSHYPNDSLPDDFSLGSDQPNTVYNRGIPSQSIVRDRLVALATRYHFRVLFVPLIVRQGEWAPLNTAGDTPTDKPRVADISRDPPIEIVGPDYWIYPRKDFSDPRHLNPLGALAFTADLARLLKQTEIGR